MGQGLGGLSDKIRVLIVDDHEGVRGELPAILARSGDVEVVGATGCPEEAARCLTEHHPEVVLLDVKRHDGHGLDLCRSLSGMGREHAVVIFTSYLSREEWHEAQEAGATDYLLKQIGCKDLLAKITEVAGHASSSS
jgi:DNA-binding NarL/FixJ family response regulator